MPVQAKTINVMNLAIYRRIVEKLDEDGAYSRARSMVSDWPVVAAVCVPRPHAEKIKSWVQETEIRCFVNDRGNGGCDFFEFADEADMVMFSLAWL